MTTPSVSPGLGLWGARRLTFEALESTNTWALAHMAECHHGDVVWAIRQTQGRGRLGRVWQSPEDRGLTFTVVLHDHDRPRITASLCGQAAAIGIARALQTLGIPARLKWPNDLLVHGRKIGGILAERDPSSHGVALGIGLNLNLTHDDLAALELRYPATSLRIETEATQNPADLLELIIPALEQGMVLATGDGRQALPLEWSRDDALAGQTITLETPTGRHEGRADGITPDGALRLIDTTSQTHYVLAGDVSVAAWISSPQS